MTQVTSRTKTASSMSGRQSETPSHADIAKRAYEIYIKNGRQPGHSEKNWYQAEQELRNKASSSSY